MLDTIGLPEILLILAILLIFFGAKRIPELAQGIGKGIKEFKKSMKDDNEGSDNHPEIKN